MTRRTAGYFLIGIGLLAFICLVVGGLFGVLGRIGVNVVEQPSSRVVIERSFEGRAPDFSGGRFIPNTPRMGERMARPGDLELRFDEVEERVHEIVVEVDRLDVANCSKP